MKDYQQETIQLYLDMAKQYGPEDVRALTWGSRHTQEVRFKQLSRIFNVKYSRLVDVGCGRGDLYDWLNRGNFEYFGNYTGIDICEHHIEYAQKHNPGVKFVCGAIPEYDLPRVDIAFASGLFGFSVHSGWVDVVKSMIDAMWNTSHIGICFNMQSKWEVPPAIHYSLGRNWDPLYWLEWVIKTKSKKVVLLHDYLKGDFTIGVRRDDSQ